MAYQGSWKIDDLLTFYANTHRFDTGAATDADSAPSYRVYEDETSTPILTGSMALLDSSNTAGFYSEQITLSAANGFEKGKCYSIYISATVNSVTATTHHTFQIEAEVDANRLNWANIDGPTTTVNLSGTTVKTATDVEADTQDIQSKIGTPAGASVSADILAIDNFVDDLESRIGTPSNLGSGATIAANLVDIEGQTDDIGTAGAGLSAIPWNSAWDTEVQSEVQDAIEVNNLDHLVKIAVDTDFATTVHLNSVVGHLADNGTSATFDRTTDSLEALQGQVETIDNFVDTEIGTLQTTANNIETDTQDIQNRLPAALVSGRMDSSTQAMANGVITSSVIAAGAIGASQIATDAIDNDAIAASAVTEIQSGLSTLTQADVRSAVGLASANLDTQLGAIDDFLDTEIAAIKAKTDNLPSDPADASDIASSFTTVNGKLDTIDDFLDTEVAAIKTKTDQLTFTTASRVDASVIDKTGFKLASDGLDSISTTAPSGVASNFREMVVQTWRRFFKKSTMTSSQLKTYADNGSTVLTTQAVSDDLTTQTQDAAS